MECARALGQRGFTVTVAEARDDLGGRVSIESRLPGLATWARVRDYRVNLIQRMANINVYLGSSLTARDVIDFGCDHAVIATGAQWTKEMLSPGSFPVPGFDADSVFTPDDILSGIKPRGPVVIYDFDHYYMGSCIAEMLRIQGVEVTIVTPANAVSAWTFMNNELHDIRMRMIDLGIDMKLEQLATGFRNSKLELTSIYREQDVSYVDCGSLVVVGNRIANDQLYQALNDGNQISDTGMTSLQRIGDCSAPGAIVHAVYSGHECARNMEEVSTEIRLERTVI